MFVLIVMQNQYCTRYSMRDSGFGSRRSFGPREMSKVTCSDCGKECEVPFKPTEGRPVYCQDCLPKHRKPRF
jgi:CxxC-x17-CxxC domain-containing protein